MTKDERVQQMAKELKRLRKKAGLTQDEAASVCDVPAASYKAYEQAVRAPRDPFRLEGMRESLRKAAGGGSSRDPQTEYVTRPPRDRSTEGADIPSQDGAGQSVPVWSGRAAAHTDRMMYLPEDLITSTALDITEAAVIPVLGSGAAPHLRHGQRVLVLPTDRVQGLDLYVYYAREQQAHLIAQMERRGEVLLVTTTEGTRTLRRTDAGDAWTDGDHTEHIQVVARVSHALIPVADVMAREQETARNAGRAVQAFLSG